MKQAKVQRRNARDAETQQSVEPIVRLQKPQKTGGQGVRSGRLVNGKAITGDLITGSLDSDW
jgi:hypothetical protein